MISTSIHCKNLLIHYVNIYVGLLYSLILISSKIVIIVFRLLHFADYDELTLIQLQNCSCLERQTFMEGFISDVHSASSDVRGNILSQLADSCASGTLLIFFSFYHFQQQHKFAIF